MELRKIIVLHLAFNPQRPFLVQKFAIFQLFYCENRPYWSLGVNGFSCRPFTSLKCDKNRNYFTNRKIDVILVPCYRHKGQPSNASGISRNFSKCPKFLISWNQKIGNLNEKSIILVKNLNYWTKIDVLTNIEFFDKHRNC